MSAPVFSPIQQEVIVLAAVLDLIDDMVNLRTFGRPITDRPTNLLPNTSTDQRMFAILLGDFLSFPQAHGGGAMPFGLSVPNQEERGSARTYLRYLREIASKPGFSGDIGPLAKEVDAFTVWLDAELTCPKVWFADLNIEFDMTVERIWVFKTVGDLATANDGALVLTINVRPVFRGGRTWMVRSGADRATSTTPDPQLVAALAEAYERLSAIGASPLTPEAWHAACALEGTYYRRHAGLAFLAPDLQRAILEGRHPAGLTSRQLMQSELPLAWADQRICFNNSL